MPDHIAELSEALDRAPGDVALLFSRGRAYAASDQLAEALADFTSVLALDPGHKQAAMGRGRILNRMGQFEAAVDDYHTDRRDPAHHIYIFSCRLAVGYTISHNRRGFFLCGVGRHYVSFFVGLAARTKKTL